MSSAFDDIDPRTESKAEYGVAASRKVELSNYGAPLCTLDAHGIDIPHRDFSPDQATAFPSTHTFNDGTTVNLFQDVKEVDDEDEAFGDFGAADDDVEDVIWTITSLEGDSIVMKVVGDWSRREVPKDEFTDNYEPLWLDNGAPQIGY